VALTLSDRSYRQNYRKRSNSRSPRSFFQHGGPGIGVPSDICSRAFLTASAWADTIHLKNGGTLEGVVLKKNEDGVLIALKYASVTVGSFEIESIERVASRSNVASSRVADWQACFQSMATRSWGPDLHPQPSPVIVDGVFKNVPYVTHASGDYQFVLYGDPEAPACLELGISGVSRPRRSHPRRSAGFFAQS
jgi:hypothetical protein